MEGYGRLSRLPREIRDQIYDDYFAEASSALRTRQREKLQLGIILYMPGSDTGLVKVSRAIYNEARPVFKKYFKSRSKKTKVFHATSEPQFRHGARASVEFPSLKCFLGGSDMDAHRHMKTIRNVLATRNLNTFDMVIEDPHWPFILPGEQLWYERLHQGLTRRSLVQARKLKGKQIAQRLTDIMFKWTGFVKEINLAFGSDQRGRAYQDVLLFEDIMKTLEEKIGNGIQCSKSGRITMPTL